MHQIMLMYYLSMVTDLDVPPAFVQLAGNGLRWRLLRELAQSDCRVRELMITLGQPQNLVSYHLGRLRSAGLVTMRRSNADGRDVYYHLDLARCAEYLAGTASALHPGLHPANARERVTRPVRVAFLCTGNSARSPMAAALLQHRAGDQVVTASAGSNPKPLHPLAIRALREYGIELVHEPQQVDTLTAEPFDFVISLCDRLREVCPEFNHHPAMIHWSIPEPADDYAAFQRLASELDTRIGFLIPALNDRR
jgi:protein-tyrosine-phosphatase/DNA-binding transcriptional ArsR family regulator